MKYLILLLLLLTCCTSTVIELDSAEIREYEGKDLSSVQDFRENSIKGTQYIDKDMYLLRVHGLVDKEMELTYDDVLEYQSYKKVVTLDCVEGWSVTILWQGVLMKDILQDAKPTNEAKVVIFRAYDGYSTSFPIEYFEDSIMLAYKMNDVTLPPERGFPFQLVAESKWGYKWIRWVTDIELSDDDDFQGYWERRGYSSTGNLNESFYS